MASQDGTRNRKRGRGKIKIIKRQHVNNKELMAELIKFKETIVEAHDDKEERIQAAVDKDLPTEEIEMLRNEDVFGRPSERLGEIFVDLVDNYATKPNFSGYPYLEEMKSRAIFFLIKYSKNFNPEKSNNAFAYCTQIVKNAFIQVIKKEKKHLETKKALAEKYYQERRFGKSENDSLFG